MNSVKATINCTIVIYYRMLIRSPSLHYAHSSFKMFKGTLPCAMAVCLYRYARLKSRKLNWMRWKMKILINLKLWDEHSNRTKKTSRNWKTLLSMKLSAIHAPPKKLFPRTIVLIIDCCILCLQAFQAIEVEVRRLVSFANEIHHNGSWSSLATIGFSNYFPLYIFTDFDQTLACN